MGKVWANGSLVQTFLKLINMTLFSSKSILNGALVKDGKKIPRLQVSACFNFTSCNNQHSSSEIRSMNYVQTMSNLDIHEFGE